MASYRSCVVYVILCVVYLVTSLRIRGTIRKNYIEVPSEVDVDEHINGEDFNKVLALTLNRLVYQYASERPPKITLANFKYINTLQLINISLEQVPVFENTNCRYITITGNNIESVPANAFSEPRPFSLDLSKNEIHRMANGSIHMNATILRLNCNKITNFSQSWFENPSSLFVLTLAGNRIEYIHDQAFNQMTQLNDLDLSHNHITRIGSEVFLPRITHLYLQFNNISQLPSDMFADPVLYVQIFYLHDNRLSFLPEALLLKLKYTRITLDDNPWQCQCLRVIERLIRERNLMREDFPTRRDQPVCVVPRNFEDVCVPFVDKELQQTHAEGLSPWQGCISPLCMNPCV